MPLSDPLPLRTHIAIGWADVDRDALALAHLLARDGRWWRGIVAVARGGLVPAVLVARALNIRLIETVSVATYDGERAGAPRILKAPDAAGDGEGWLIVDDLVDSGATLRAVRAMLPKAHAGVLYAKPDGRALADQFVRDYPQDCWIDFPWELPPG